MKRYINWKAITKVAVIMAALFSLSPGAQTQSKTTKPHQNGEKLITALVDSKHVRGVFGDDGMYIFSGEPEIEAILKLKSRAIPLLIAHLDDKRTLTIGTNYPVDGEHVSVTVGAACLDILSLIIREDSHFFSQKCLKELEEGTVSSCLKKGYGIYPEDFWQKGVLRVKGNVSRAKRNWLLAYNRGQIHYHQPG